MQDTKRSIEQETQYRKQVTYDQMLAIMENVNGGVTAMVIRDGMPTLLFANEQYFRQLGYTREQFYEEIENRFDLVCEEDKEAVEAQIRRASLTYQSVSCEYRARRRDGSLIWMQSNISVTTLPGIDEPVQLAVANDIDQLKTAQLKLAASSGAVEIASRNGGLSFWMYHLDSKTISQSLQSSPVLGYPKMIYNVPESLCGTGSLPPEDEPAYRAMHQQLLEGAESCDCTVRLMNHNLGKYEWQHIFYTRLHDSTYPDRVAIGFSVNVDLEQENRLRYEREMQLRREMINNSVTYFQINLTTGVIEEYYSQCEDTPAVKSNTRICEAVRQEILSNVVQEDRNKVFQTVFEDALIREYSRDHNTVSIDYRRHMPGMGIRWLRATANIMERPRSGELIAFVNSQNIDIEKKDQLAIESIMDEEIEYVMLLNVASGQARMVQVKCTSDLRIHQVFDFNQKYGELIRFWVLQEDQKGCERFFSMQALTESLQEEEVIKFTYHILDQERRILRKKSRAFYLDATHEEIVLIRRDITDLYEEEQRQKLILQNAVDAAVEANHAKSDFLSRMSHDMRTPLNAVLSFSDQEMTDGASESQLKLYLDKIHASGEYLLGIINDVLDVSKIEQEKMVLNPVPYSMDEFIGNINTVIEPSCKSKNINFMIDVSKVPDQWIRVDKIRFNQIFINLLSNAVKFTAAGGRIEFVIQPISEMRMSGMQIQFEVRDNGIGMSPEFLPRAFESFSQEYHENISEKTQGTGLGLTIVKEIVTLMKGTIAVKSTPGVGTVFTVVLPLRYAEPPAENEIQPAEERSLEGMRILLCEDNEINIEITVTLLEKQGCIVDCAQDGQQGLELFQRSEEGFYDAVLMDIRMPVMNGLDATRAIRNSGRSDAHHIPIIAMTADAFSEDAQISNKAGMNAHLSKPIEPKKVFDTIRRVTRRRDRQE